MLDNGPLLAWLCAVALVFAACDTAPADDDDTGDDDTTTACSEDDVDGDGLDGCAEEALGTDPDAADTDGDGLSDGEEADCVSDPLDGEEVCYACGWAHDDPGDLVSTGASVGDVVANMEFSDVCEETIHMWDFVGEYHILWLTASW